MADPFALTSDRQRAVVFVGGALYLALFVLEVVLDSADAAAMGDLVIAALALPAGAVVLKRSAVAEPRDELAALAGVAFLVAGVAIGYGAVTALSSLSTVAAVEAVGTLGLLVGVGVFIYRTW